MTDEWFRETYGLEGQVAVVTGGGGVLGRAMAEALARAGAGVTIIGRRRALLDDVAGTLAKQGLAVTGLSADVLDRPSLEAVRTELLTRHGRIDILVNAAGGNIPGATLSPGASFFDLPVEAFGQAVDLNLLGTLLPIQVFGVVMAAGGRGSIVNISSMTASRAVTRVAGYSAAKAAVDNLTRWLATEFARAFGEGVRVNAIAPGFFISEQNHALLLDPTGNLTERGRRIIDHTPAGRFGAPTDLASTVVWLCGPGARFVTGIVVPVDGGFSAFSGV